MNLKSNIISRLFEDKEIQELKQVLSSSEVLVNAITKIMESRWIETRPKESDFEKSNYEFRRAFLDGRSAEITWWIKFLEGDGEGEK